MNYIEQFMKDNDIGINGYFGINGSTKYLSSDNIFYIDKNYCLRDKESDIEHTYIFRKLLMGVYFIAE